MTPTTIAATEPPSPPSSGIELFVWFERGEVGGERGGGGGDNGGGDSARGEVGGERGGG
eukprot:CAMPEP_0119360210 /NCGR_PEP_ID=MMETSP1334-20130426/7890_1 /TAXON_ID=127549 /ORGANISM="Calcidiscus leptoporus, Strain RCC1130" /LENGTH=58 /DNA_ID=CAMNT_0007375013 /DNA_START=12 /DNA_END=184 /DNA_ORIENTATION=+